MLVEKTRVLFVLGKEVEDCVGRHNVFRRDR